MATNWIYNLEKVLYFFKNVFQPVEPVTNSFEFPQKNNIIFCKIHRNEDSTSDSS